MDSESLERAQRYLLQLLGYLEAFYTSSDKEDIDPAYAGASDADPQAGSLRRSEAGLPQRIASILGDCGYLEGMRLKGQGYLSSEILEFIQNIGFAFEVEIQPSGPFKLPFLDNHLIIQRKTLNTFMVQAWLHYHSALLSAYCMRSLRFVPAGDIDAMGMEERVTIVEEKHPPIREGEAALSPEFLHKINNYLGGIVSFVSLMLSEDPGGENGRTETTSETVKTHERLELILESARKSSELIRTLSVKKSESPLP